MKQDQTSHGIGLLGGYENIEQYTGTMFFHLDGSVENIQSLVLKSKIHEVTQHLRVTVIQIGLKKKDLVRFLVKVVEDSAARGIPILLLGDANSCTSLNLGTKGGSFIVRDTSVCRSLTNLGATDSFRHRHPLTRAVSFLHITVALPRDWITFVSFPTRFPCPSSMPHLLMIHDSAPII